MILSKYAELINEANICFAANKNIDDSMLSDENGVILGPKTELENKRRDKTIERDMIESMEDDY